MLNRSKEENKNYHEIELIQACCSQDSLAQELLYRKYYGYAMGICLRYTHQKEEAMELVNDSFLKVFKNISMFNQKQEFRSWIRKIIINTVIDAYKRKKYIQTELLPEDERVCFQEDILDHLSAQDLLQTLQTLPEIQRVVFNLYEMEGYSHREIAKMLKIKTSTSRSYLTRAKERLKKEIIELIAYEIQIPR